MAQRRKIEKGYHLEELLRSYFLRAGFFAVRGVPFQHAGDDLTDIDVWLYERPTGSSRRRQIVDAKSKTKPKAVERLLWTKGLVQLLDVDGAYVATTDTRSMLRGIAKKLGISVLDGADIKRIQESGKVVYVDRMSEEEFIEKIQNVDKGRRNKEIQQQYRDVKFSLIDNFGNGTINRALDSFAFFSSAAVTSQPNSNAAEVASRLSYFAAAVAAISLDYVSSEVSFRASDERRTALINAIRLGNTDEIAGLERVRLAVALIERYAPSGDAAARAVNAALRKDLDSIPAEIIADHIVKTMKSDDLFQVARRLEHFTFARQPFSFDTLGTEVKAYVAVLLDYCGIDRVRFASNLSDSANSHVHQGKADKKQLDSGPLFSRRLQRPAAEKA